MCLSEGHRGERLHEYPALRLLLEGSKPAVVSRKDGSILNDLVTNGNCKMRITPRIESVTKFLRRVYFECRQTLMLGREADVWIYDKACPWNKRDMSRLEMQGS